jgi:hypothetical protein
MQTQMTEHAHQRIKERLKIKSFSQAEAIVEKAWLEGTDIQDEKEVVANHVSGLPLEAEDRAVKFFRQTVFVFDCNGKLITVYRVYRLRKKEKRTSTFSKTYKVESDEF